MQRKALFFTTIAIFSILAAGCGSDAPENTANSNSVSTNRNASAPVSNNPLETKKEPVAATTNNAPTLTPVFRAYCAAKEKGDEAALRQVYSQDTLKRFEAAMKSEGARSLVQFLEDDQVTTKLCEARNEQIQGNMAIAEVKTEAYPNGVAIYFVQENGQWKMTDKSPALDAVKKP